MSNQLIITGTDTGIGKTLFSAALMLGLESANKNPHYWKPVQSGIIDGVDTKTVQKTTHLPKERFLAEKYIFSEPLSPHRAAEIDNTPIDMDALRNPNNIPECDGTLVIEGAGGLMVPLSRENLLINLFKEWNIPLVLCARTGLGTINHTLLSLEAIWSRGIPLKGIVFIGEENLDNIRTISEFSNVKILGHMPIMDNPDDTELKLMFGNNFKAEDFV
ncbi:MAG: dethiobiotin synthase [Alphaproteobacteria bacterium]